jgi:hypothetical protein
MGLCLYSLGAILFWPVAKFSVDTTNKQGIFGGFVVCTAVIACGLATLEVAANSYVSTMPPVNVANFRLQFSQSFNGVASFSGPLIASKYFFSGSNSSNLTNVQWVYLAVSGMGMLVALAFIFTKLPEVSEEALQAEADALAEASGHNAQADKPFYKQYRAISGFVAQVSRPNAFPTMQADALPVCVRGQSGDRWLLLHQQRCGSRNRRQRGIPTVVLRSHHLHRVPICECHKHFRLGAE